MFYRQKLTKLFFITICCFAAYLLSPLQSTTSAHPLDEFYQATFITLASNRVNLIVEQYPGILVAPKITALIDTNGDELISEAERQTYVSLFLTDVTFEVDGVPTPLQITALEFPTVLDLRAGIGVIRFYLSADLPANHRGDHALFYENNYMGTPPPTWSMP